MNETHEAQDVRQNLKRQGGERAYRGWSSQGRAVLGTLLICSCKLLMVIHILMLAQIAIYNLIL